MQVVFHGHSFLEIVMEQGSVLIDPYITGNRLCDVSLEEICQKQIVAICITHGHGDHIGDTLAIKEQFLDIPVYTVTSVAKYLQDQGCTHCLGGSIGGTLKNAFMSVKLVIAHHDGAILDSGRYTQPAGMVITIGEKTIYHMGDTSLTKDFELIGEYGPKIDCLFVPIGDFYTMGIDDAVIATKMIRPTTVVPIHYNTSDKIKADDIEFARKIMLGQHAVPKVLRAGQYVIV